MEKNIRRLNAFRNLTAVADSLFSGYACSYTGQHG